MSCRVVALALLSFAACGKKGPPQFGDPGYVSTAHDRPKVTKASLRVEYRQLSEEGTSALCPGTSASVILSVKDDKDAEVGSNWLVPTWTVKPEIVEHQTPPGQDESDEQLFHVVTSPLPDNPEAGLEPIVVSVTLREFPGITASIEIPQALACKRTKMHLELGGSDGSAGTDGKPPEEAGKAGDYGVTGLDGGDAKPVTVEVARVTLSNGTPALLAVAQRAGSDTFRVRAFPADATAITISNNGGQGGAGGKGAAGGPGYKDDGTCTEPGTGGTGGSGGRGGNGADITVRASKAILDVLTVSADGRLGGPGGRGGTGGVRCDDRSNAGKNGKDGNEGKPGKDGKVTTKVVPPAQLTILQAYIEGRPIKLAE